MAKKAITLIELIIVIILVSAVILGIAATSLFFIRHIAYNIERYNIHGQINYALEDMKLRCISSSQVASTSFFPEAGQQRDFFEFNGEGNIHAITPDNLNDNANYRYQIDSASGNLVLLKNGGPYEVLIEGSYHPQVIFEYKAADPPNIMKVIISARGTRIPFSGISNVILRTGTVRFWFIDIVGEK